MVGLPSSPWKPAPSPCSLPSRAPPASMAELPFSPAVPLRVEASPWARVPLLQPWRLPLLSTATSPAAERLPCSTGASSTPCNGRRASSPHGRVPCSTATSRELGFFSLAALLSDPRRPENSSRLPLLLPPASSSSTSLPWHFPLRAARFLRCLQPPVAPISLQHPVHFFHPADSLYCPRRGRYFPWPSSPLAASFSFSPALRSSSTVKRRCSCSPDTSPCFLAASAARVPRARQTVQVGCCAANSTSGCPPGVCCFAQPRRRRRSPR
jgi:hypothetical protein